MFWGVFLSALLVIQAAWQAADYSKHAPSMYGHVQAVQVPIDNTNCEYLPSCRLLAAGMQAYQRKQQQWQLRCVRDNCPSATLWPVRGCAIHGRGMLGYWLLNCQATAWVEQSPILSYHVCLLSCRRCKHVYEVCGPSCSRPGHICAGGGPCLPGCHTVWPAGPAGSSRQAQLRIR